MNTTEPPHTHEIILAEVPVTPDKDTGDLIARVENGDLKAYAAALARLFERQDGLRQRITSMQADLRDGIRTVLQELRDYKNIAEKRYGENSEKRVTDSIKLVTLEQSILQLKLQIQELKLEKEKVVTQEEWSPYKKLIQGGVGIILTAVLVALIALVVK